MKKLAFFFIIICLCLTSVRVHSQEEIRTPRTGIIARRGAAAAHSSFDAVAISMTIWGVLMGAGIATAAYLIDRNDGTGGNGGNGHFHD